MNLRLQLNMHGQDDGGNDEEMKDDDEGDNPGCLSLMFQGRKRASVHPVSHKEGVPDGGQEEGPEDVSRAEEGGLVDLERKIDDGLAKFEKIVSGISSDGDLFEKLDKQTRILWLKDVKAKTHELKTNLNLILEMPKHEIEDKTDEIRVLTNKLKDMHGAASSMRVCLRVRMCVRVRCVHSCVRVQR